MQQVTQAKHFQILKKKQEIYNYKNKMSFTKALFS